jgi:pimeloyl-ACP methyl ester carboxylesterase
MYPQFQEYLRGSNLPVLAPWGENDIVFPPIGAELLKTDVPDVEIHLLDAGHFVLETDATIVLILSSILCTARSLPRYSAFARFVAAEVR